MVHCTYQSAFGRAEVFRFRNYDPETGSARKHARLEEKDTVEKQVEGLAEKVITEDEARRAEELDVRLLVTVYLSVS